jgi:PKD repeat protein
MQNRSILSAVSLFLACAFQTLTAQSTFYQIVGPEQVCLGDCAAYSIQSPGNPGGGTSFLVSWSVSGPNGFFTSSQQNPATFCFPAQGFYLLKAQAVSANGILVVADTLTVQVTPFLPVQIVSDNPALCDSVDVAGSSCERVCPNTTVTYSLQNYSSGLLANSVVQWSVNGAESFTVDSLRGTVTVTWGEPGAGSVSAVVFSGQCVGEDGYCVTIVEAPKAAFVTAPAAAADTLRICQGQTVGFDNQSTDADTYEWFFGDGSAPVGEVNPQHDYPNPGVYTVSLIARSGCLCADTATQVIEVLAGEAPVLDCVGTVCAGATVTYSTSANCTAFNWSVSSNGAVLSGGGASDQSITIQWTQGPAGLIRLLAQNCAGASCPEAVETRIPVIDESAEIRGAERVCPGAEEVYTITPYQGAGFVWTLSGGGQIVAGQGTNRVAVRWAGFPSPGLIRRLSVQYDNCYLDCGGRDTIEVRVLSPFVLDGPVELCENTTGIFQSRLTIPTQALNSNWTVFGPDGSVAQSAVGTSLQANFTEGPGIYQIRATPADPSQSCSDQAEWAVSVPSLPAGPSGIDGNAVICPGEPFTYRAAGLPPGANVRWTIQNGAGAPGTALGNPLVISWGASGPRTLRVENISSDGLNCPSPALQVDVAAFDPALAVLSGPDSVCLNGKMELACSLAAGLHPVWSIPGGGGSVISGQGSANVTLYWNVPGIHTVQATVCGQTISRLVTVLSPPAPMVTQPAGACPGSTALVGTTTAFAGYQWQSTSGLSFGQDTTAVVSPGDYLLTVADDFGCTGSASFRINTYPTPNASVSTPDPTGFCNNNGNVRLRALSGLGAPPSFEWFLNGVSLGVTGSEYIANQYGSYSVVATNAAGCTAAAGPVVLFEDCGGGGGGGGIPGGGGPACPPGAIAIQTTAAAQCDTFSFSVQGTDYAAGSGQWFFGQSGGGLLGNAAGDQAGFQFPNAGVYFVLLRASLTGGGVCEVWDTVAVQAVAQFDTLPACAGLPVQFTNISSFLPYSGIAAQSWDFGDPASGANNTASSADPQHIFAAGGTYHVTLTVTALSGCTAEQSALILIPEGTALVFSPPSVRCANTPLLFTGLPGPDLLDIAWDFGDPASGAANVAAGDSAYHAFAAGSYTISATTTNLRGCTAVSSSLLTVSPNLLAGSIAPAAPAPLCAGQVLTLTAPAGATNYLWSDNGGTAPDRTVSESGLYSVTLTDANGCTFAPPGVRVEVVAAPEAVIKGLVQNGLGQVIGVAYPQMSTCFGEEVRLITQGAGNYSYTWTTGSMEDEQIFSDTRDNLLNTGTHVFYVTITDNATGCTAVSAPFISVVNPVPAPFTISQSAFPACAGAVNLLSLDGAPEPNTQYVWNTGATGPALSTTEPGAYRLRAINQFGCEAGGGPLTVLPGPNVRALPSGCHTRCKPDTLCLPPLPDVIAWQWYLDGLPVPGATSAQFIATQSGAYWAVLTDIAGCTAQSDPLRLDLYDGFGSIFGEVWSDVNNNGLIDAADTLVRQGVDVRLWQNNATVGSSQSGANGHFAFANIPSTNYVAAIDTAALSAQWKIVIGAAPVALAGCNATAQARLLLRFNCQAAATLIQLQSCAGDSLLYNGVWLQAGGNYDFSLTNALGCDSLVSVAVSTLPASAGTLNAAACAGDFYDYNGTLIPAGQSRTFTLDNYLGCDSVLTVNVAILPVSAGTFNAAACPGGFYDYNGTLIPAGQSRIFTLDNYLGCDSVLTVNVATLPASAGVLNAAACPGGFYDYNGTLIPAGQSQTFTLNNYLGCDSVLTVNVATLPVSAGTFNAAACPGGFYDYNGTLIPAGQSRIFTLNNYLGCDSVLTVRVETLPVYNQSDTVMICPGAGYLYNGVTLQPGDTRSFRLLSREGCDSTVTIHVTAFPGPDFAIQTVSSCSNRPGGALSAVALAGGVPPFEYSLDGQNFQSDPTFNSLLPGDYTLYLRDGNDCLFEKDVRVNGIPALAVELPDAVLPCALPAVVLRPLISGDTTGLAFRWSNGAGTPAITATESGFVWVEVTNQCETVREEALVTWEETDSRSLVYVPNVFAPAASYPENDRFRPYFADGLLILRYDFVVADRWGNLLFRSADPSEAWEGPFRAADMQPAVFVWYLEADIEWCGRTRAIRLKGDVTIVR